MRSWRVRSSNLHIRIDNVRGQQMTEPNGYTRSAVDVHRSGNPDIRMPQRTARLVNPGLLTDQRTERFAQFVNRLV